MMSSNLQHRRTHNLLLISKLLNQKEAASPFTLVIDDLEQSAKPLLREYTRRAHAAKNEIIYVSYETLRKPKNVDIFIPAWKESFAAVQKIIATHTNPRSSIQRKTLIIDSLHALCSDPATASNLPAVLSSFFSPNVSVIAVFHSDTPISSSTSRATTYSPHPLTLLKYLATTINTTHSLHHVLAKKAARDRSVGEPVFGLEQGVEGILMDRDENDRDGLVLEMEYRRKSGRGVREWYYLPYSHSSKPLPATTQSRSSTVPTSTARGREKIILLEDHPLWQRPGHEIGVQQGDEDGVDVTFELGLTERQRRDREGVVLPYFDAQKGGGEGGRILYDMGVEDDFDEEEDEI